LEDDDCDGDDEDDENTWWTQSLDQAYITLTPPQTTVTRSTRHEIKGDKGQCNLA